MPTELDPRRAHDLDQYLHAALTACDGAGKILNEYFGNLKRVDEKFQAGLVSDADRESEKWIVDQLLAKFPTHAILGEESGLSAGQSADQSADQALWMIDPLDGTTNYVHQFPVFCISIGLELAGELVVGVVDAPKMGLRYHAVKGRGAYLNGERISVSARQNFRDGLFATGFNGNDDRLDEQLQLASHTIRNSRGLRRAGAAALDLCFVAQGIFDAFWERSLQPWDTAAGTVIAREAGGIVTDMDGGAFDPRSKSVLCGSLAMHASVLQFMRDHARPSIA